MATTISRARRGRLQVYRLRQGTHVLRPQSDHHRHPARANTPRVIGAANRAPGTPIMGAPDSAGDVGIMGGTDAGPPAYLMGGPDAGPRADLMGSSDPSLVDSLFTRRHNAMTGERSTPCESAGVVEAAGFELASRPPLGAAGTEIALERNRAFAAAGGHEGAVVFANLGLFVITCLDPRVDPAHFLGLGLGDAVVVRNVGGRVTPEMINDIAFIAQLAENVLPAGALFEIAVIHHTQCGTGALADVTFRHRYARRIGAKEGRLLKHAVLDPAATVTHDVELLRGAPQSPRASPCPGTCMTSLPAWFKRFCQPSH